MGRYRDIAHAIADYEKNELNELPLAQKQLLIRLGLAFTVVLVSDGNYPASLGNADHASLICR
jgi:hypothetical protein